MTRTLVAVSMILGLAASALAAPPPDAGWQNVMTNSDFEDGVAGWNIVNDLSEEILVPDGSLAYSGVWFARLRDFLLPTGHAGLSQITAPFGTGDAMLEFQLHIVSLSGSAADVLRVLVDDVPVWSIDGAANPSAGYEQVQVSLRQFADGASHALKIEYVAQSQAAEPCEFHVDLVEVWTRDDLVADFQWSPQNPAPGEAVTFTDLSTGGPTSWSWNFGDGSGSSEQNPVHIFDAPGTYQVRLTIANSNGGQVSATHAVQVSDGGGMVDFSWSPQEPHPGEAVTFLPVIPTDCSVLDLQWDFGDGTTSMGESPVHVYEAPGTYEVTLQADSSGTSCSGLVSHELTVHQQGLEARFVFQPESPRPGDTVQFLDTSVGNPDLWHWDFGDGAQSTEQNPVHAYLAPGEYPVTLTIGRSAEPAAGDSVTQQVVVAEETTIDFTWTPATVSAQAPVTFTPQLPAGVDEVFWGFGDGESSDEFEPTHIYLTAGRFPVELWAAMPDGSTLYAEHELDVQPAASAVQLSVSNTNPEVGEPVNLVLNGAPEAASIAWNLQDPDCQGHDPVFVCQPQSGTDCRQLQWRWGQSGVKLVRAWIVQSDTNVGPFTARVDVSSQGGCGQRPTADFDWWPLSPHAGEPVQFADQSAGTPTAWSWSFGDGDLAQEPYPEHVFEQAGTYTVALTVANQDGTDTRTAQVEVTPPESLCGDGVCSADESAWSCPEDCGDGPDATGRSGTKGTSLAVPAAASHVPGLNGTVWFTEGSILNPGTEPAQIVARFVKESDTSAPLVRRLTLPRRTGLHFQDLVGALFGTTGLGALRLRSDNPTVVSTRTYNSSLQGTFGQSIGGIARRRTLGEGEGHVFLLGLKENLNYRTNLLFQETTGHPAAVEVRFYDPRGELLGTAAPMDIPPGARKQVRLATLGADFHGRGYCTVEVTGEGRVAVIGSVVDQRTGDAVTVDAIHPSQVAVTGGSSKAMAPVVGAGRYLVAVVARTPGINGTDWRSEVTILNPNETQAQNVELLYIEDEGPMHQAQVRLEPGQEFFSDDAVSQLFPDAGQGSGVLHVISQFGVAVNSRTYTVLDEVTGATAGQFIPGLAAGDLIKPGEVWILPNLKSTDDFRCNLGFSEAEGSATHVTVTLFDMSAGVMAYLAAETYAVPAFKHMQVTRLFDDMGLTGTYPEVLATLVVADDSGTVYAYGSIVDNESGDATTILPVRQ